MNKFVFMMGVSITVIGPLLMSPAAHALDCIMPFLAEAATLTPTSLVDENGDPEDLADFEALEWTASIDSNDSLYLTVKGTSDDDYLSLGEK